MEHLGLVGLPNAGRSSLFNALTGSETPVALHFFSTTSSTTGVAVTPRDRLVPERLVVGSPTTAKDAGRLRVEGTDYEVVVGDVMEIRFTV